MGATMASWAALAGCALLWGWAARTLAPDCLALIDEGAWSAAAPCLAALGLGALLLVGSLLARLRAHGGPRNRRGIRGGPRLWCAALLGAQAVCVAVAVTGTAMGWTCWVVESGSMEPSVPTGALAVCRPVAASEEWVGEVVAFEAGAVTVIHRVVAQEENGALRTQGDANDTSDGTPVGLSAVRGIVVAVAPGVGAAWEQREAHPEMLAAGAIALEGCLVWGCASREDAWREARGRLERKERVPCRRR